MAQVLRQEIGCRAGHGHGLGFEGLAHALAAPVDGRANADLGHGADQAVRWRVGLELCLWHMGFSVWKDV